MRRSLEVASTWLRSRTNELDRVEQALKSQS